MLLTEGQVSDYKGAATILPALPISARTLIGDKGYDGDALRAAITARGIDPCTPQRKGRNSPASFCKRTHRRRNLVERMFGHLKDWRRIATRYDRCAHTFFSAMCIAATVIWWINKSRAKSGSMSCDLSTVRAKTTSDYFAGTPVKCLATTMHDGNSRPMTPDEFITRWAASGGAELANAQPFVIELCALLEVEPPNVTGEVEFANDYTFEKAVKHSERGLASTNRIDCYKRDCFILEAKQSSTAVGRAANHDGQTELLPEQTGAVRAGTARRGTPAWDRAMRRAYGQAKGYVGDLPADHDAPPFLVLVDVGHVIELYADFSGTGRNYTQYPSRADYQIPLDALADDTMRARLKAVWTEPLTLNPAIRAAKVTADIAERLAKVAKLLEGDTKAGRHEPATVATFLMRCLFTMFAEDVELLPKDSFKNLLGELKDNPQAFVPALGHLWATMDAGGYEPRTSAVLRKFNGSLFKDRTALPLPREGIHELHVAAGRDWRDVEPAIFGTLLERALDTRERAKLGAHYTPRAYVERLVIPTIIEPLREDWQDAQARMAELVDEGDDEAAFEVASAFHHQLCTTRVLDPACGTGNFLYVALELLKRLEGEVLEAVDALGSGTTKRLAMRGETVDPSQFHGLEVNPRAVPIADLVLWIGYLKWQLANGGVKSIADPVLHRYDNIVQQDAVLAWDARELRRGERGAPVTTWDGFTTKPHPVTGLPVPDEAARVEAYTYRNPKRAKWPEAEFIVGNPPFIGGGMMRGELGDGYAEAVWKARPEVPAKRGLRDALVGRGSRSAGAEGHEDRAKSAAPVRLHHHQLDHANLFAPGGGAGAGGQGAGVARLRRAGPSVGEGQRARRRADRHDGGAARCRGGRAGAGGERERSQH